MITYNDIYEAARKERYSDQLQPLSKVAREIVWGCMIEDHKHCWHITDYYSFISKVPMYEEIEFSIDPTAEIQEVCCFCPTVQERGCQFKLGNGLYSDYETAYNSIQRYIWDYGNEKIEKKCECEAYNYHNDYCEEVEKYIKKLGGIKKVFTPWKIMHGKKYWKFL